MRSGTVVALPEIMASRGQRDLVPKTNAKEKKVYKMLRQMWNDEAGFVVSAELVLVSSMLVIGLIVGMSEVQHAVVSELNDVADAIGEINQSYSYSGFSKKDHGKTHAQTSGSDFEDQKDDCDQNQCDIACDAPSNESRKSN